MDSLPAEDALDASVAPAAKPGERVLVVDDNLDAADMVGALLELEGRSVRVVHDGPSAVFEAERFNAQYILMDIGLPGFSGIEATRRIRRLPLPIRPFIIALTGLDNGADRRSTAAVGCDCHLVKPVTIVEILAAMQLRRSAAGAP